jgi:peptide/nickel transport system permease protein
MIGAVLTAIVVIAALVAPLLGMPDPNRLAIRFRFRPPFDEFLLGTDNLGRSMLSRVIWGAQLSLLIGLGVVALNAVFGVTLGAIAGYFGRLDGPLMRFADALMAFPSVLLGSASPRRSGPRPRQC